MKISPINVNRINPVFKSRHRVGQDDVKKNYQQQAFDLNTNTAIDGRAFLHQRFNFIETANNSVDAKDRTYDSFTGLRDKNYLLASLDVAMNEAQKNNKTLSIAMFDMDNFKSVNELLGYETGDIFIKEISREIAEIANGSSIDLYRFGGEEFILIFDNQSDAEKNAIVKTIAQKINSNSLIQSYRNLYMKNAQSRLDKALYSTAKVQKISILETKRETLEEVRNNLNTKDAKNDPYFEHEINYITEQIKDRYIKLIDECLAKEQDEENANMLEYAKSKLSKNEKLSEAENMILDEYLNSVYDRANEIYQTKKWMHDFKQNNGFGMTCGVVNFEPDSLEYKNPMDLVEKSGKVLKRGKSTKKGQVYFENIRI